MSLSPAYAAVIVIVALVVVLAIFSSDFREMFRGLMTGVFIPAIEVVNPNKQLDQISQKLEELLRQTTEQMRETVTAQSENSSQTDGALNELRDIQKRLAESEKALVTDTSLNCLQSTIDAELIAKARAETNSSIEQLWAMSCKVADEGRHRRQQSDLEESIDNQLNSAASIRRAMLNLFVLFNIGLLVVLLLNATQVLAGREVILGLYISMATFIVYVYRSSNARVLILLAVKEDLKRYHDAQKYILRLGAKSPSEKDVEVLKLLTLNRVEREGNNEHPYELVLKGISNSNILFKGGKIASSPQRSTNAAARQNSN